MRLFLARLLFFLLPAVALSQVSDCSFTGAWNTNWGAMQLVQVGDSVWGTYTHDNGRISGTVNGSTLRGVWSEAPSYSPSRDAGNMQLTLSPDCKSFTGGWRYGVDTWTMTGGWSGDRAGYSASGRITANGVGVSGVAVSVGSSLAVTNEQGYFSAHGLLNGQATLSFTKPGYRFTPSSVSITIDNRNVGQIEVSASTGGGGGGPGEGCDITIHTMDQGYEGDFYPAINVSTYGKVTARDAQNVLYAHYSQVPGYCYFRKSTNNGTSWSDPIRTESEPNASGVNTMLVGADGVIHVADQFNVGTYYKRSVDGGTTWSDPFYLHDQGWGDWDYSAQIAFDGSNNLHAVYYAAWGWSDPPFNVKWRRSTDNGQTWESEVSLTDIPNEDANGQGATVPVLSAGPGDVLYVVYALNSSISPQRSRLRLLSYNGSSWDQGIDLTQDHATVGAHDIVVDAQGVAHIVYARGDGSSDMWNRTLCYRTVSNGVVSSETILADDFEPIWTTSLGIIGEDLMVMIGTADLTASRGSGVWAMNISESWPCPVMVSKTDQASQPNIPWAFHDIRPAGTRDVTWVESDGTTTEFVLCDATTFKQGSCGGGDVVSDDPSSVTNDTVTVELTQIVTDAVGYPTDFPVVDLNVAVTESRVGMVGDLTRGNFSVYEDGVPQAFSLQPIGRESIDETEPAAVVVVLDNSTAVTDEARVGLIQMVEALKDNMQEKWSIAVLKYADRVQKMVDFTNDADKLIAGAASGGPVSDEAVIMSATSEALTMLSARTEPYRAAIVITSGVISDPQYTAFTTQQAASKSMPVYIFGLNDTKADPALRTIAERSGGMMFTSEDDLDQATEETAATLGNAYRLQYTSTNPKRDGSVRNVQVVLRAPLANAPSTIVERSDAKTYRAPVNGEQAVVSFEPARATLPPATSSNTVTVALWVSNITDVNGLMGAELRVEFDPAQVEFVGSRQGEFLSPPPNDFLSDFTNTSGADAGVVVVNIVRVGGQPAGLQGTGPLYYLSFRARSSEAASAIRITSATLRNAQNMEIDARTDDGMLVALTAPNGPGAGVGSVFSNYNASSSSFGAAEPPHFTITEPYVITRITSLHAGGADAGQLSIKNDVTGQVYGPWNAVPEPYGATQNGLWVVTTETQLPEGTYIVIDSDPTTWTYNDESNRRGMVWIDGRRVSPSKPQGHLGTLLGDFDGNDLVNFPDYTAFVSHWNGQNLRGDLVGPITGEPPGMPPFTIETYPYRGDGAVNFEDQIVFAQMYNWTRGFAKVTDLRDIPTFPLFIKTTEQDVLGPEREVILRVHDVQHLLGAELRITADEQTLHSVKIAAGSWFAQQAPDALVAAQPTGGGLAITMIGLAATDGVFGSGELIRLRYLPSHPDVRLNLEIVNARDIANRPMAVSEDRVNDVRPPMQVMPIPANDHLRLRAVTGRTGPMTTTVVNMQGQIVATLVDGEVVDHTIDRSFDVSALPTGVYLIRLEQGDLQVVERITIVR